MVFGYLNTISPRMELLLGFLKQQQQTPSIVEEHLLDVHFRNLIERLRFLAVKGDIQPVVSTQLATQPCWLTDV